MCLHGTFSLQDIALRHFAIPFSVPNPANNHSQFMNERSRNLSYFFGKSQNFIICISIIFGVRPNWTHGSFEFVASILIHANIHFQVVSNWGLDISLNQYNAMQSQCFCCLSRARHKCFLDAHIRARTLLFFFPERWKWCLRASKFQNSTSVSGSRLVVR